MRSYIDLALDGGELLLRCSQLRVGLTESAAFGFHLAVDVVEPDDIQHPGAQTSCSIGLGGHQVWQELWILETNSHEAFTNSTRASDSFSLQFRLEEENIPTVIWPKDAVTTYLLI